MACILIGEDEKYEKMHKKIPDSIVSVQLPLAWPAERFSKPH